MSLLQSDTGQHQRHAERGLKRPRSSRVGGAARTFVARGKAMEGSLGRSTSVTRASNTFAEKGCGKVFPSVRARGVMVEPNQEKAAALKFPGAGNFAGNIFFETWKLQDYAQNARN